MALRVKSIDEETNDLTDIYDDLIAPKKVWRNHNNKIYLILRAYAAGNIGLNDAALALRNRFNPMFCDDIDLYSTAKIVGTEFKQGSGSILRITITNKDSTVDKPLPAGTYNFLSASGQIFYFEVVTDIKFDPLESRIIMAISREKGSFHVGDNANIRLFRTDNASIDSAFAFSCEDNSGQLGYEDEDAFEFRTRILNDANRQDHIKELELKVRNLPNIFECNLVINDETIPLEYDGILLQPKELLITITGVPTDELAETICKTVLYDTHKVKDDWVVWYNHPQYINGRRPVYYREHELTEFSLSISYQYDAGNLRPSQVEDAINGLFKPFTQMVTHIDAFTEGDAYRVLDALNLPNVRILNITIYNSSSAQTPYVKVPKTRLPRLTGIDFTPVDISGGAL